ncbi:MULTISPECIES: hypothetical protein [unclassified Brevibacterium]|uniref:hypothetical protein n=1 Tax=unclassified Brevibacterium TaxID=2614124 RepID=UPI0010C78F1E|nr:hypothetical protein [Brevibacterium sp. CS2]QCP05980.1 hypothetical protein FDF13_12355 [Brevibacterium sp. CS2]
MPLVFSPPPHRSRARDGRPASSSSRLPHSVRPAARIGALAGVAALVLSGCTSEPEEHTLATPTAATPTETEGAGPEYTTDLQLSEEEKKAVEEALKVLNRYAEVSTEVFTAGGAGAEKFDEVAKDSILLSLKEEAKGLRDDKVQMVGEFGFDQVQVFEVDLDKSDSTAIPLVNFHACVPVDRYSYTDQSPMSTETGNPELNTFEVIVADYDGEWFVSEQYLWAEECDI